MSVTAADKRKSIVYYVFISGCYSVFKPKSQGRRGLKQMIIFVYRNKMSRIWKINYDNIKKILILQPAQLSNSLQSYLKTVP